MLRKVLGAHDHERQFIETVPRRGYRFIATVTEIKGERAELFKEQPPGIRFLPAQEAAPDRDQTLNVLAVLPFVNGSADPHAAYLSDGITEDIINHLSQLRELRVMSRSAVFRYQHTEPDPQIVGRELGVQAVLTGRMLQLGDRLIIRAELIDVTNGWQLWGAQYHRQLADVLTVQEELSGEIFEHLRLKLTSAEKRRLTKRYTEHPEAYQLYLKGRYYWNKYAHQGLQKGLECFQQAIARDPTYALAYAGLADSYYRLSNTYEPTQRRCPRPKRRP